ncbi:imidazole glycerol phosphate synthase subunit HisH [Campylobacter upsaliensis]|uniref:Imidazole glycerol phosphate synthase subunit HisH n=1 Tax=Campylobacter upsaliensis JV21 TaxID=888826 RepID=A0A828QTM6_CAMUP|nr:imidazole glycerol phosphate synthase subunit HisH [Campylobacter upsaliensis]EAB5282186.1 imidazole glycerol phosphate synthase subunit HisH [Campylobacter upsaliensis]EAH6864239.1 imidazole glycerol phosphate synthase subunit HisH [Campylobacter upsaliensis]EAH7072701.1 imidazole glycerol phosphate synthase subunit HisH [Campylobacter upsaliensis]EAH7702250.1 imidazole glycerol phosphate synthase subunit HisH [Campylobacter upsaliensis]EAH8309416.1 imidazole glycerol phosphate synthase su
MKLYIIDTACANLASLKFSLERLAYKAEISRDLKELEKADKLFLPGVGTAATAMRNLEKFGLCEFIKSTQKPLLGICLGMQILGDFSEELEQKTLGIMPFKTLKFEEKEGFSLPHMGWNEIKSEDTLFKGLNGAYFYFVHSYCAGLNDYTIATCEYSKPFSAAVKKGNFYGVQFHPERSGEAGELLLKNFILL